jgi:hypothetical protein
MGNFGQRHQEELLIPFGRALAWSYVIKNCRAAAVCLLRLIQNGEPPFGWSTRIISKLPLQPIRELLERLVSKESGADRKHISPDLDHPLVEITSKSKQGILCLSHSEQRTLQMHGILFRQNSIVIRKSKPYQLKPYPQPRVRYGFFRHQPIRNETMNRDVMQALVHQPTSSYSRGRQHRS